MRTWLLAFAIALTMTVTPCVAQDPAPAGPPTPTHTLLGASGAAALIRLKRTRPLAVAGLAVLLGIAVLAPIRPPSVPTATFLDVGQGDAVLLQDPSGGVVLVDGGRDPLVLEEALRRHGINKVDLLVGSHGDVDHVGGFEGMLDAHAVGRLWVPDHPDQGPDPFLDPAQNSCQPEPVTGSWHDTIG